MRRADGIAAEFLQFFQAKFLQRVRNGRADAGMVLMIASAVNLVMFSVQKKSIVAIKSHSADAKGGCHSGQPLCPSMETVVTSV